MPDIAIQPSFFQTYPWTPSEIDIFRRREPLTVSQWAERHRVLSSRVSSHPGPWRNALTPYLTEIMDTMGLPEVREVVLCKSVQIGGTEGVYNFLGYCMDYDPGPTLLVQADEELAKRNSKLRLMPMLEDSQALANLKSDNPDNTAKNLIILKNGMAIYNGLAKSPAKLSSTPCRYVFFDETDKYPQFSGDEASPIKLGKARTTTYPYTSKSILVSTPTIEAKFIWQALNACQMIMDYYVPCQDCGKMQVMKFEQFRIVAYRNELPIEAIPADAPEGHNFICLNPDQWGKLNPHDIKQNSRTRYECECGSLWNDAARNMAVRAGKWFARNNPPIPLPAGENPPHPNPLPDREREYTKGKPSSVGFHLPVYYSPFVGMSDIAAEYIEALIAMETGDESKMMHFFNSFKAEPYKTQRKERKEDAILALRDDRPRGIVPPDISCLLMAIDTQKRGFWYEIRAFGYGLALESWQVQEGYVDSFKALETLIYKNVYLDAKGTEHTILAAAIDSGGGKGKGSDDSRTAEVYDFCRTHRGVYPLKGRESMNTLYRPTQIDYYPGGKKPLPGGIILYLINTTYFKNTLANKLQIAPTDPGAWHLHADCGDDYAQQMCVEFMNDKGIWECPRGKRNHFWDVGVYMLFLAELAGVRNIPMPDKEPLVKRPAENHNQQEEHRRWS